MGAGEGRGLCAPMTPPQRGECAPLWTPRTRGQVSWGRIAPGSQYPPLPIVTITTPYSSTRLFRSQSLKIQYLAALNHRIGQVDAEVVGQVAVVGDVPDDQISLLARFQAAQAVGQAAGVGGVDG